MKYLLGLTLMAFIACNSGTENSEETAPAKELSGKSVNSEAFNTSFENMLNAYYQLKDQLVAEKVDSVIVAEQNLTAAISAVAFSELADTITVDGAKILTQSMEAELKAMQATQVLDEKRKSFEMLGNQLYELVKKVQYDRAVVYQQFCPMAFDDKGATWLSNISDIRNPYLPKTMLICGEVQDSVDLRK
ncbi:MAG: DUF3347 domain-containing protein [Sediminibacterium sp.]|jgi:Cu(I)/Ag(I) efflux system membrane fusion protein|nr:DUF3347 domain-containing protein [Sediminibacterium sp.]